ncbi:MAG: DUF4388 domain-containing protein [Chloroflexaceae bacterium]|jgi:DNA-binding MarR family transcriptional regulator|nr:DUF4388 domain-containing protein [Chloroflexaceae bacterium]
MALAGDISEFPLTDIIQLVDLSKKTGAVYIDGERGTQRISGKIYFRDGKIIGADVPGMPPLEAVYTFFTVSAGPFRFIDTDRLDTPTITASNELIIMEGIGRQEAWAEQQAQAPQPTQAAPAPLPPLTMVPRLSPNPATGSSEINLEAEEWRVLTMVNGKNSVGQIAQRSGLGEARTAEIIGQLLANGLIEHREHTSAENLMAEYERIATTELGPHASGLLEEACRQARITDVASASSEQMLTVVSNFEQALSQFIGAMRARRIAEQMRARARSMSV